MNQGPNPGFINVTFIATFFLFDHFLIWDCMYKMLNNHNNLAKYEENLVQLV